MTAKVLVVDDSAVYRGLWTKILEKDPEITVVGTADDGMRAVDSAQKLLPDVVVLDLEMPRMGGCEALPLLMAIPNPPKVVIVSSMTKSGSELTIQLLMMGASDYVTKPTTMGIAEGVEEVGNQLLHKVKELARKRKSTATSTQQLSLSGIEGRAAPAAIVVGSSTGGPSALMSLLGGLGSLPVPIFLVQHMPPFFLVELCKRISLEGNRPCVLAENGMVPENGVTYLAPGDQHLTVEKNQAGMSLKLNQDPPENFCRPAVDPLFRSAAAAYGSRSLGIVLTGMGEDGMRGAGAIREAGGAVLVQDEASSVVWGMPGAVARAGFASAVLTVPDIAKAVSGLFGPLKGGP